MCGIVGIIGPEPVASQLVKALALLEYRGYDSAGVGTLVEGKLQRRRTEGKLSQLVDSLQANPLPGKVGIGHTRWATHGDPNEENAHPHATEKVSIVHNGIIENFRELRKEIEATGRELKSQTDTEVIAHLITLALAAGKTPLAAVQHTLPKLQGAYAFAAMFEGDENLLIAVRKGSPLTIAKGDGKAYLGSDAIALAPFATSVTHLKDGDLAVLTAERIHIFDKDGQLVDRPETPMGPAYLTEKGKYETFMAKEIAEQSEAVQRTLARHIDFANERVLLPVTLEQELVRARGINIVACGTSYHAGLVAQHWFERFTDLPVNVDVASEFRYRDRPLRESDITIVVSQSGQTKDTHEALEMCKKAGQMVVAVVNVEDSPMASEADVFLPTLAGPEIGVASTKAFTAQLAVLAALAVGAGVVRGTLSEKDARKYVRELASVPRLLSAVLEAEEAAKVFANFLQDKKHAIFLGRGTNYPVALEGALKLKEISYINANGYAAGELKHGPLALVDLEMPVIVVAPFDRVFEKTMSNVSEVMARQGRILLITDQAGMERAPANLAGKIVLPTVPSFVAPIVYVVPLQQIAYHTASLLGRDIDKPRNLAKSVTVE